MPISLPVPDEKKLNVIHRVEAGCLGPQGHTLVAGFCIQCEKILRSNYSDFINWKVIPRMDKSDPEFEYGLMARKPNANQLDRYLGLFNLSQEQLETNTSELIGVMIERYTAP